ncbi:MAG: hypothetical protein OHK0026_03170 [Rhodocyclaceae bacterium]
MKWLMTLAITVLVAGLFLPRVTAWLGLARLPGDICVRLRGRLYRFPFGSVLLLSALATVLFRLV